MQYQIIYTKLSKKYSFGNTQNFSPVKESTKTGSPLVISVQSHGFFTIPGSAIEDWYSKIL